MKKLFLFFTGMLLWQFMDAQMYLKPVITPESSPGACDASITVIPYGGTPPYSINWYSEGTWAPSSGFTCNNICSGDAIIISITDANCFDFYAFLRLASNPSNQPELDTLIITLPTPGNNDGSVDVYFSNVPSGATTQWGDSGSGGTTTSTTFTGLDEDQYHYGIVGSGSTFSIQIPLFSSAITPCEIFRTEVYTTPVSTFLERSPECVYNYPPDTTENDTIRTSCDGSVNVNSFGAADGDYFNSIYFHPDGGASGGPVIDSILPSLFIRCRGPHSVVAYNNSVSGNNFYNYNTVFVQDSLDLTYLWNFPDTIPSNTDTVVMDALNVPAISHTLSVDTAFIHHLNYIGADQYEVVTAFIQSTDTFLVYTTEYLDSSYNYILDITTFEGDSLLCDVNNAYRHLIYFEWPEEEEPCDSVLICHIPPGNPSNAHSIWVPCEDVEDHLNHGDVLGDCNEMEERSMFEEEKARNLSLYPNPFSDEFRISSSVVIQSVDVFSLDGKQIMSIPVNAQQTTLDTKGWLPSTYFIRITYSNSKTDMRRMVKMIRD